MDNYKSAYFATAFVIASAILYSTRRRYSPSSRSSEDTISKLKPLSLVQSIGTTPRLSSKASRSPSPTLSDYQSRSSSSSGPNSIESSPSSSVIDLPPSDDSPYHTGGAQCNAVIFDLGDVLFTWSAKTKTSISPKLLRKILRSATWFEYEKGNLSEQEAYDLVALEFNVPSSEVGAAFQGARDSLQSNPQLIELISELKRDHNIAVYAMSNISAPDWEVLREKATPAEWALFDRVFTSASARERKPNLGFYRQVLDATGVDPLRTVFVDDKLENVLSARSVGLRGIVFDSFENVARQLRNFVADPVGRGQSWLQANAKTMLSVTDGGVVLHENFAPLLIIEATEDPSLADYVKHERLFNFFQGDAVLTTATFPCDLDTTSIGLTVSTHTDLETKHSVMDEMLTYKNKDGIVQTYFDCSRPRIDPIVCTNVLTFFHSNGRGTELEQTLDWVYSVLKHRAYLEGTLYYYGADTFLFFLSRLMEVAPTVHARFAPLFTRRMRERFGAPGDSLALAMRICAASRVQLVDAVDYERLCALQEPDGAWPIGWVYKYGGADILIGNKGLTTAIAVKAIKAVDTLSAA